MTSRSDQSSNKKRSGPASRPPDLDISTPRDIGQLYGRRKGHKLKPRQQRLVSDLLPQIELELGSIEDLLSNSEEAWLEIGFGGGEHLVAQAAANRDVTLIGSEIFLNGIAKVLIQVEDQNLSNIRLFTDDAKLLLQAIPDQSLTKIFLLFPDPWPKTRQGLLMP